MNHRIDQKRLEAYRDLMASLDPAGPPAAVPVTEPEWVRESVSRVLVVDASYNPPTVAHREIARIGFDVAKTDYILLQLSRANVDKGVRDADLGQRLYMLTELAANVDRMGIVACSHARFVDKAAALADLSPRACFIFAIGYDTLTRLFDAKYYRDMVGELDTLFESVEFIVANRAENDPGTVAAFLRKPPRSRFAKKFHKLILPQHIADVSSTDARQRIREGASIEALVPKTVVKVIDAMGLYTKQASQPG